jgi:hypothetical protein
MKAVNRRILQTAPSEAYQRHLLVVVAVLAGCGGRGLHWTDGAAAGAGGEGGNADVGGVMASGGNAQGEGGAANGGRTDEGGAMTGGGGSGGVDITLPIKPPATGGVTSCVQDGGVTDGEILGSPDGLCDDALIWETLDIYLGGGGGCMPTPNGQTSWGYVILDSAGRVIEITRSGVSKTKPVDALACDSWPCLAGQTIPYFCQIGS